MSREPLLSAERYPDMPAPIARLHNRLETRFPRPIPQIARARARVHGSATQVADLFLGRLNPASTLGRTYVLLRHAQWYV
ncbi:hypothetical protein HLB23_23295 [Nocardia uniformis]|uniref:Uncharacterized protein n=1 Tax=Nocardia uniformis TaxID=53432 RepID=A0A849C1Y3_9NOCA|nr:hypothetical protein [Nocardia uniformis]NNH72753.1 hypothetical protein [Nocardia uniformis]